MSEKELTPREKAKQEMGEGKQQNELAKTASLLLFRTEPDLLNLSAKFFALSDRLLQVWSESLDREEKLEKEVAELKEKLAEHDKLFV